MSNYIDQISLNGVTKIIRDTTLESKNAAQNGEDVSLVTTGEKYLWNHKGDGAITTVVMNNTNVTVNNGTVDLGTVITDISGKLNTSLKGTANGLAELDSSGKVPSGQLPSYVDDVEEYNGSSNFPATGESGKIYVDTATNITYRWSGSTYVPIGSDLALGETSSTAYRGDRGKIAYDHASDSNKVSSSSTSGLYKIAVTSEGHIASVVSVQKSDITNLGIPGSAPVQDVQIASTSILSDGVANIPYASNSVPGVVMTSGSITIGDDHKLWVNNASDNAIKEGVSTTSYLTPSRQEKAVFYGLTKAAGVDMASSSNAVGTYTDAAKTAIRTMIGAGTYTKPSGGIPASDLAADAVSSMDISIIADEYDPQETYTIGKYCTTDGKLYKATSNISGEQWNSSHWDETTVMEEIIVRCSIIPAAGVYF